MTISQRRVYSVSGYKTKGKKGKKEETELDERPNYLKGGYFTLGVKGGSSREEMSYYDAV